MQRRPTVVLLCAAAATVGCTRLNPAFIDTGGGETATGDTSGTASGSFTGSAGSADGGTGSTTGAGCVLPDGTGQSLRYDITDNTAPVPCASAGLPVREWFRVDTADSDTQATGSWCAECNIDMCTGCGPATVTLTIEGPAGARPPMDSLPAHFRVGLFSNDAMAGDCSADLLSLSTIAENGTVYPFYVMGNRAKEVPSDFTVINDTLDLQLTPTATCDNPNCPGTSASIYELSIGVLGITTMPVGPGQSTVVSVELGDNVIEYRVSNVEARDDVACDEPPKIYWSFGDVDFLGG